MENKEKDLAVIEIVNILWRGKFIIIFLALAVGLTSYIRTKYSTKDLYAASGVVYVSNKERNDRDNNTTTNNNNNVNQTISQGDIMTSRTITSTYIEVLKTGSFLEEVSDELGGKLSWGAIGGMLSVSTISETELLKITIKSPDPEEAYEVANAVLKRAPDKLVSIFEGGEVSVVDRVRMPTSPVAKGIPQKTMLGFFIGTFFGVVGAFIRSFLDTKVHSAADISKKYHVSILGEIAQPLQIRHKGKGKEAGEAVPEGVKNVLSKDTNFDTTETYKAIRTNIMYSIPKSDSGKVIVITSSAPSEGKTTTAINLENQEFTAICSLNVRAVSRIFCADFAV